MRRGRIFDSWDQGIVCEVWNGSAGGAAAGRSISQGTDWGPDWGKEAEELWGTLSLVGEPSVKVKTERGDYRGFYANVRDAIEKKTPLEVTPEQALRTMRAVMLAHKSSRERRTVEWSETTE